MKVMSFLPAVTQMIYDMGLQHKLHGITFECPEIALQEKPKIVRYKYEGQDLTSAEIDEIFSKSKADGEDLYYVDEELLHANAPDLVFTQDICEVCSIDTKCTEAALSGLPNQPKLIPITPEGLTDVFDSALVIAEAMGELEAGKQYLNQLNVRIDAVVDKLRKARASQKRVSLLEWIDPIYNCGHWIPDQIALAGGVDMLSNPSGDSIVTNWEKIVKYNPEILVIAPCGFDTQRSNEEIEKLTSRQEWSDLKAVKNDAVYLVDFQYFTQSSASTLVDGIEILASLIHPDIFELPENLNQAVFKVNKKAVPCETAS